MAGNKLVRRSSRIARFSAQSGGLVLACAVPVHALAQCSPDPAPPHSETTCSGTGTHGFTIATDGTIVTVAAGASVTNTGAAAILASIPASASGTARVATIDVNGTVSASGAAGILLTSGTPYNNSYNTGGLGASIVVAQGGTISGTTGITLARDSGAYSASAPVNARVDNSGTISGTNGVALSNSGGALVQFSAITNHATGVIGAIAGSFGSIQNDGLIDGGTLSAIDTAGGYTVGYVTNTGTIRSANATATIANTQLTLTNSGTVINTGGGAAIGSTSAMSVINLAGGTVTANGATTLSATSAITLNNAGTVNNTGQGGTTISSGAVSVNNGAGAVISAPSGGTAIAATNTLVLNNVGVINGNIDASAAYGGTAIDSTQGTINGNVVLGSGNDTLMAIYNKGALITGITGTIDGGGGTNTLNVAFNSDATLSSALPQITNFNKLTATLATGTTLTLAAGFTPPGTLTLGGSGTLVNQISLSGTTQVFATTGSSGSLTNQGSITTTAPGSYAAMMYGTGTFTNSGTITAAGSGVYEGGTFTNSGTITAAAIGVYQFSGSFANTGSITGGTLGVQTTINGSTFTNSGSITATGGTGLSVSGSSYLVATPLNSGTVSGVTGLVLSGVNFNNSGTISGSTTGASLGYASVLTNLAGGTISGGAYAINNTAINASVVNAGTITGNVNLANPQSQSLANHAVYVAKAGGMLTGTLTLGGGRHAGHLFDGGGHQRLCWHQRHGQRPELDLAL